MKTKYFTQEYKGQTIYVWRFKGGIMTFFNTDCSVWNLSSCKVSRTTDNWRQITQKQAKKLEPTAFN